MFESLISEARSSAGSFVAKYLARASVVVPFAIALGFATAAIALILTARFGSIVAYSMIAAGFTAIGLVSAVAVGIKERGDAVAVRPDNSQTGTPESATSTTEAQIDVPALAALIIPFILTQLEPSKTDKGANVVLRNIPLVTFAVLLALLLWPVEPEAQNDQPGTAGA